MKKAAFVAVIAVLLLSARFAPRPIAQSQAPTRAEKFNRIASRLASDDTVSVIVHLADQQATPLPPDDSRRIARLQSVQNPVAALASSALRRHARPYPLLPYIAMRVDRDTLARLQASSSVIDVTEEQTFGVSLLNSQNLVGAVPAWQRGHQGQGWTVAVLDSGVERTHPFLTGRVVNEACFSSRFACPGGTSAISGPGTAAPLYNCPTNVACWHGTHVAGIAAGNGGTAQVGFSGMALSASIMAIRLEGLETGSGAASLVDLALQYVYANRNAYRIGAVNLSLDGDVSYTTFCDDVYAATKSAIDLLRSAGIPTVISAGNTGYINALAGPSCISSAVSVGSTINAGQPGTDTMAFANRAPFLSLVAPGENIYSSDLNGGYRSSQGTSLAAPHVSGALTLLREASPASSVTELVELLRNTGKPIPDSDPRSNQTYYRIDINRAVSQFAPAGNLQIISWNFNADFFKDLFIYNRSTGAWTIKIGDFASGAYIDGPSGGWAPGWDIKVANFNGDNRDDLFLYNNQTGVWYKVINTITSLQYFTQGWQPGFQIFIGGFNGDGRDDVFVYNPVNGVWFMCLSTGTGTGGFDYRTGQWAPNWQIQVADFNLDSRKDLFLYSRVSGLYYKVITQADFSFAYTAADVWALNWTPFVMDLNGDTRSDVFLYDSASGLWYRCLSTGTGTGPFTYSVGQWAPGWSIYPIDLNPSGSNPESNRTDLLLYSATGGGYYKAINDGANFTYYAGGWAPGWTITPLIMNGTQPELFLYNTTSRIWYRAGPLGTTPTANFFYTSGKFY